MENSVHTHVPMLPLLTAPGCTAVKSEAFVWYLVQFYI